MKIQKTSIYTVKSLGSIIKTCLDPRAMQNLVITKINSIKLINNGNSTKKK